MKRAAMILAVISFALAAPLASFAMEHGSMKMEHDGGCGGTISKGEVAHDEVIDGVDALFMVIDIKAKMKEMGMKETHHIMVGFTDDKSGNELSKGEVKIKVQGPDKKEQVKELMGMEGGFGADFTMSEKGKYGIMAKFKLNDGKVRSVKFWYSVK